MADTFLNRDAEINFFKNDMKQNRWKNRVIILAAPTGIGKSSLCRKALTSQSMRTPISIEITGANVRYEQPGFYLRRIARAIDQRARYLSRSDQRLPAKKSDSLISIAASSFGKEIARSVPAGLAILETISKYMSNRKKQLKGNVFEDPSDDALDIVSGYLQNQFDNTRFALHVENTQIMDYFSLQMLSTLLSTKNEHYFIFEYTMSANPPWPIETIVDLASKPNCDLKLIEIEKLPFEDFLSLSSSYLNASDGTDAFYRNWDGNLKLLKTLEIHRPLFYDAAEFSFRKDNLSKSIAKTIVRSLNNDQTFVLSLIIAHFCHIESQLLEKVVGNKPWLISNHFKIVLLNLQKLGFVRQSSNTLQLAHDSDRETIIMAQSFEKLSELAYQELFQLYWEMFENNDYSLVPRNIQLTRLMYFSARTKNSQTIFALFDDIEETISKTRRPNYVVTPLLDLLNLLTKMPNAKNLFLPLQDFIREICWLLYRARLFNEIEKIETFLQGHHQEKLLLQVLGKMGNEKYAEMTAIISSILKNLPPGSELSILLSSLLGVCNRACGRFEKANEIVTGLLRHKEWKEKTCFGFILRNAELTFTPQEAIPYLNKSVKHFRRRKLPIQESYGLLALSGSLCRLGKLSWAWELIEESERIQGGLICEPQTVLNNKGVIQLYSGNPYEAFAHFEEALSSDNYLWNRMAILSNMAISRSELDDHGGAVQLAREAEHVLITGQISDPYIRIVISYNVGKILERAGFEKEATVYRNYLEKNLHNHPEKEYWLYRKIDSVSNSFKFRSNFWYSPIILSHWMAEIDGLLELIQ